MAPQEKHPHASEAYGGQGLHFIVQEKAFQRILDSDSDLTRASGQPYANLQALIKAEASRLRVRFLADDFALRYRMTPEHRKTRRCFFWEGVDEIVITHVTSWLLNVPMEGFSADLWYDDQGQLAGFSRSPKGKTDTTPTSTQETQTFDKSRVRLIQVSALFCFVLEQLLFTLFLSC